MWRYAAFELDPSIPAEGVDARAYLEAKYDTTTVAAIHERLAAIAAAEGVPLDPEASRTRSNTFAAHRVLTAALEQAGPATQQALAEGLFHAYWADARDIGDPDVLEELAGEAGLGPGVVRRALEDEVYARAVREEERLAQQNGIHAVPTFILDDRFSVSGAQPAEVLAGAVRRVLGPPQG